MAVKWKSGKENSSDQYTKNLAWKEFEKRYPCFECLDCFSTFVRDSFIRGDDLSVG